MAFVRWTFSDGDLAYTLDVNPRQGGSPRFARKLTYRKSSAPDGAMVIFEGRKEPRVFQVTGAVYSQEAYYAIIGLFARRNQVLLTDDLGREFWVYITGLQTDRVRSRQYPWKHTYTMDYVELDSEPIV